MKFNPWLAAALCSSLLLTGCPTAPVTVKTIVADPETYVRETFAPAKAEPGIISRIEQSDREPLHFSKLVLTTVPHVRSEKAGGNSEFPLQTVTTYVAVGGPFATDRETTSTNGLPNAEFFSLNYRGIFAVLSQSAQTNALNATAIFGVKEIKTFQSSAHLTAGQHIEYSTLWHSPDHPTGKPWSQRVVCDVGAEGQASSLNKDIKGTYHSLKCEYFGDTDQTYEKSERVYLDEYGISVVIKRTRTTFVTDFDIVGFEVTP